MTFHLRLHRGGCMDPRAEGWDHCPTCGAKPEPPNATGGYVSSDAAPILRDEYVIHTADLPPGARHAAAIRNLGEVAS